MTDPDESGDRGILDPEELELDDDRVTELDDNRYIVDTGGGPSVPDDSPSAVTESDAGDRSALDAGDGDATGPGTTPDVPTPSRTSDDGASPSTPADDPAGGASDDPSARETDAGPNRRTDGAGDRPPAGPDPSDDLDARLDELRANGNGHAEPERETRPRGRGETTQGRARPGRSDGGEARAPDAAGTGLSGVPEQYGMQLTVKTDRGVDTMRVTSNDVREVFEETLRWYAGHVDPETPPEEVVRILLSASEFDVR